MQGGKRTISIATLLLACGIGILANMLAQRYKFRADLTSDKRYTLDPATLQLLQHLPETVTVTAYVTADLPPEMAVVRQDFMDLLVEYANRSGGKLVFEFVDPGSSPEHSAKAVEEGIRPLLVQTRRKDRSENLQVFMGATLRMADRKAVVPAFQKGPGMEWTLTSALAQLLTVEKPLIGVMQGHHEPSLQALDELAAQLNAQYDVEATAIYDSFPINDRFTSLLIIDPKDSLPAQHLGRINEYMAKGHGVVLAFSAVAADFGLAPKVEMRDIGLGPWLAEHGLRVGPGVVVDRQCGQIGVVQATVQAPVAMDFPFYPLISKFGDHPIDHGLDLVMFQFASPMQIIGDSTTARYWPVVSTSGRSGVLATPLNMDLRKAWTDADFPLGPQMLGAAREPHDSTRGRLVVFSNGSFCTGEMNGRTTRLPKGNLDLMVNATDWVTHHTALLSMRGKEKNYRPITDPGEAARTSLKWLNLLLPPGIMLLYGLLRVQWRRRQRRQRMQPGHVQ
ncbi:MAG: GldG family protein [Bacteroidetes bacterium]|nr:GldG family protein [Bacteroidota bacterium]